MQLPHPEDRSVSWSRRGRQPEALDVYPGDECEAFLAGRYLAYAESHGLPLQGWMWLNRIAHGSWSEVAAAAATDPVGVWDRLVAELAGAVTTATTEDGLRSLQQCVLVPVELQLIGEDPSPRRVRQLVDEALGRRDTPPTM